MKIGIVGAGAVGGHLAVCLARAGFSVSVVARGSHLQAIRSQGLKLIRQGDPPVAWVERLTASDDLAELGRQDVMW